MSDDFSNRPFEALKGVALKVKPEPKPKPKTAIDPVSHSTPAPEQEEKPTADEELFLRAMEKVREIKEFREIPFTPKKRITGRSRVPASIDEECLSVLRAIRDGKRSIDIRDTQEYAQWCNPSYKNAYTESLHRGVYSVQDYLDLHGYTLAEAEVLTFNFISDSLKLGYRCVKIIHGRGLGSPKGPVLKNALIKWLAGRLRKHVIAFTTARSCDGGLGALYVLLKKG
ncbi:MAG: Smr/MutS family protein [Nitrospirae bacterium]|nr:Smr/MutS family protein [Nitrospirota bacterium]